MLLAYIDESGDTGPAAKGGTLTYSLGCVLVDADAWPAAFDQLLEFRRRLKITYGVPIRAEIKANYLLRNSGDLRQVALGPGARRLIYRAHLSMVDRIGARAFGVVIDKRNVDRAPGEVFDLAWQTLMQRLERTSTKENVTFALLHDEGENDTVRRWARQARRYLTAGSAFGTGGLQGAARLLVDDPIPRKSHQSYFIQLADLVAYAAFRANIPPSPGVARVCPADTWLDLGAATHVAVSGLRPRSAPGIVLR